MKQDKTMRPPIYFTILGDSGGSLFLRKRMRYFQVSETQFRVYITVFSFSRRYELKAFFTEVQTEGDNWCIIKLIVGL